jgi:lipopolysaccharide export system protein LptC
MAETATSAKTRIGPLNFLRPRETERLKKARGPRRVVGGLRLVLPLTSLLVLFVLVLWPAIDPNKITRAILKNAPDLVIDNLHFNGLDSKNQPYSIGAAKATRPAGVQNIFDLEKPEGEITLDTGAWISGKAQYGRFDHDKHKLWLGGDVQLFHDKGYQFTSDEAQIDLNENYAWGEKPVLIQGDFGEIRGQGFRLLDNGHTMIITGPASALLNLHSGGGSDKPPQAP